MNGDTFAEFDGFGGYFLEAGHFEFGFIVDSLPGYFFVVEFVVEGEEPSQKQIQNHPQRPQVHLFAVGFRTQHFRGHVTLQSKSTKHTRVPKGSVHLSLGPKMIDNPKSTIFSSASSPEEVIKMFSGLRSLWTTPKVCK